MDKVAKEIKDARIKAKLTQKELGDAIETPRENIARIEAGKQNITIQMLQKIANALGYQLKDKLLTKKK